MLFGVYLPLSENAAATVNGFMVEPAQTYQWHHGYASRPYWKAHFYHSGYRTD